MLKIIYAEKSNNNSEKNQSLTSTTYLSIRHCFSSALFFVFAGLMIEKRECQRGRDNTFICYVLFCKRPNPMW